MNNKMDQPSVIQENWKRLKDQIRQKWHQLTDDELEQTHGDMNRLEGLMTDRLGSSRDEARRQLQEFMTPLQGEAHLRERGGHIGNDFGAGPDMISEGIRRDVQDFGPREGAGLQPGVPSGIQSGISTPNVPPVEERRFDRQDQMGGSPTGTEFGSETDASVEQDQDLARRMDGAEGSIAGLGADSGPVVGKEPGGVQFGADRQGAASGRTQPDDKGLFSGNASTGEHSSDRGDSIPKVEGRELPPKSDNDRNF